MRERKRYNQTVAAARAGISERTGRRLEHDPRKPSERQAERYRTVPDPLAPVWENELVPMLETDNSLRAITLLHDLHRAYPDRFPDDRVRRTLERRVRDWKALNGPRRPVIFRQQQEPGRQALSDFTDATKLGVTVAGESLAHLIYHFVLPYSGWQFARVVLGGESFTALAENLQDALGALGGVPAEHRTDSLSAAFTEEIVTVLSTGGFWLRRVFYSVPSTMIGHRLRVHIYDGRIEAYLGSSHMVTHTRHHCPDRRRGHVVDYRHVIHSLKCKPQALAGLAYRDSLFPRYEYRQAWEALQDALPQKEACRRMMGLLAMAHEENCEAELAGLIAATLRAGKLPEADSFRRQRRKPTAMPDDIDVSLTAPASFDALLSQSREANR